MGEDRFKSKTWRRLGARWVFAASILASSVVTAWLLAARLQAPWLAACVLIRATAGVMYWLARANGGGVFLWAISALLIGTALWAPLGDKAEEARRTCRPATAILLIGSAAASFVAAVKDRTRRGWNCAGCDLALFSLIALIAGGASFDRRLQQEQSIQGTTDTLIALYQLGAEVDSIRERTGQLPKDEQELVALRGEPMPVYEGRFSIKYSPIDDDHYRLECIPLHFWGYQWDMFGWIVRYYGPAAPRRMRIVLF